MFFPGDGLPAAAHQALAPFPGLLLALPSASSGLWFPAHLRSGVTTWLALTNETWAEVGHSPPGGNFKSPGTIHRAFPSDMVMMTFETMSAPSARPPDQSAESPTNPRWSHNLIQENKPLWVYPTKTGESLLSCDNFIYAKQTNEWKSSKCGPRPLARWSQTVEPWFWKIKFYHITLTNLWEQT